MKAYDQFGSEFSNDGKNLLSVPFFIKGKYKVSESVVRIKSHAFAYCDKITKVEIPSSVKYLEAEAFEGCDDLRLLILPDSLKYIDAKTFVDCPNINVCCPRKFAKKFAKAFEKCTVTYT